MNIYVDNNTRGLFSVASICLSRSITSGMYMLIQVNESTNIVGDKAVTTVLVFV